MRLRSSLLLLFLTTLPLLSQSWIKIDSVFSPFGVTAENFSAPFYGDLDNDGDLDLIIASLSADRIEYFKNIGTPSSPVFRKDTTMFSSIYANGTQFTNSDYVALVDIDHDKDLDLVIGGFNGMQLYWNGGDNTEAIWFRDTVTFSAINTVIGTDAMPAFADLDGDGDEDLIIGIGESLFAGPTPGITMGFRNNGTPTTPTYVADNTLVAGIPDLGLNSFPAFGDLDNDGDWDLIFGRDLQTMLCYRNTGTKSAPVWTSSSGVVSIVEANTYWKVPTLADIDGDGDLDMTYGTSDGTLYQYKNIGSKTAPQYQLFTGYFQMIRTDGNAASVSLADFDKDGDVDMLSGDWLGGLQYFRNNGTATQPNFVKTTAAFTALDAGSYSVPRFVDIDGDGDQDIVSGELLGTLLCWINNNGTFSANTTMFAGIDVGYRSAPAFADIDKDGDMDMFVGAETGSQSAFYRNNGSNVFTKDSTLMDGFVPVYVTNPVFVDLDKDADLDLIVGGGFGDVYYFENIGTKGIPKWQEDDAKLKALEVRQGASAGFADFDGDGRLDAIVSEYNGNFSFFKNAAPLSVSTGTVGSPGSFALSQNFPNPFNPSTTITFTVPASGAAATKTSLEIFDLLGRRITTLVNDVRPAGTYSVQWQAVNIPSGMYLYRLRCGELTETKRMLLLK